jgi:hypothetical protein
MYELKRISKEGIPAALERATRYRLLGEPSEAESICLDVFEADPNNTEALIILLLALTDQFEQRLAKTMPRALDLLSRIPDRYGREYYAGVIRERQGKAFLRRGLPGARDAAYPWLREAMTHFETASEIRPPGDDSAILRWNACARIMMEEPEAPPQPREAGEDMLE